jgi:REP element-mobilizing transposase RayT
MNNEAHFPGGVGGYQFDEPHGVYFLTLTVVDWIDVFIRPQYCDIIVNALKFYQEKDAIHVFAFVIMTNHVHLIVRSPIKPISDWLRNFKRWTANRLISSLQEASESRRTWILEALRKAGSKNADNQIHQFWQSGSAQKIIFSEAFGRQKLDYIHQNPVKQRIVWRAADYVYSSASNYEKGEGVLDVKFLSDIWYGV